MVIIQLIVYFISCIFQIKSHKGFKCGHSEIQKTVDIQTTDLGSFSERFLGTASWEPIRIYVDYANLESQLGMVSATLIQNLKSTMPQAVNVIQQLINVKRTTQPLIIKSCHPTISISSLVSRTGVAADLVIFPYFDITFKQSSEAFSAVCNVDLGTGRPLAGLIGFQKDFDFTKKNALENRVMLAIHELTHVLGFSSYLVGNFIDSNGSKQAYNNIVTSATVNGKNVKMIKTPKVVATARKYFNCPSLIGVELEDQGDNGIPGSHWESRVMWGDYMIGTGITENVISEITLALLEDSGWYQANYYTGGLFRYGKHRGCKFLNTDCVRNNKTLFPNEYPITDGEAYTCFAGRTGKGFASLISYPDDLPTWFQYYPDTAKGGFELADFCPVTENSDSYGWYDAGSCTIGQNNYAPGLGETIGSNSTCFYSSLTYVNDSTLTNYLGVSLPVCFEVACNYTDSSYDVTVRNVTFACPTLGGAMSVSGFNGTFYCADFNLICTKTVECGSVFDCVAKKSLPVDPVYISAPLVSTQTIDLIYYTLNSNSVKFSLITLIIVISAVVFSW